MSRLEIDLITRIDRTAALHLRHCAIAVSDWLAGGCDVHDIPRPHIAALVEWVKATTEENIANQAR